MSDLDEITEEIASLIVSTDVSRREDILSAGRRAFADYLASALAARRKPAVIRTAAFLETRSGSTSLLGQPGKSSPENAAFFNGFESHYLDFDDAEANLMGHGSTVLFSALLPLARKEDRMDDFFSAYAAGMELEGILGKRINPSHKQRGWHPTATLGPIGAAAAIARFRRLSLEETAELLSLGATQSSGLGLEAGTDTKPLHAGFAARNGVFSYFLLKEAHLTSSLDVFNNEDGWAAVLPGISLDKGSFEKEWLNPGELISPGLWMKEHQNCSAAIPGSAAVKALYEEGLRMDRVRSMTFHFPPGRSYSLHHHAPRTGQQARFSMEFAAWEILTYGTIRDNDFLLPVLPPSFAENLPKFSVKEDLPPASQETRRIVVTAETKNGTSLSKEITHAPGSPENPLSNKELTCKLALGSSTAFAEELMSRIADEKYMKNMLKKLETLY